MKRFLSIAIAAGTFCTIVAPGHAQTTTIDFEHVDTTKAPFAPLLTDHDYVTQSGYYFTTLNGNNISGVPDFSLVGALFHGADSASCLNGQCPTGNTTNYIGAVNDGMIGFGQLGGGNIVLSSFDAAFLSFDGEAPTAMPAYLAIEADRADGSFALRIFELGPVGAGGTTGFQTFQASGGQALVGTGTLTSGDVTAIFAYAYYCDPATGGCLAFDTNKGQFALDNIVVNVAPVTAVPEAATWAMMLAGFGGIGGALRRKRGMRARAA
jgi:hypothetical protein